MRVKTTAEADKLAGRAPKAAPAPAVPAAPQPATAPALAAPVIDEEARALLRATLDSVRALSDLTVQNQRLMQQAQARIEAPPVVPPAAAPEPEPTAPAEPPARPGVARYIAMPLRAQGVPVPAPAPTPAPAPAPEPAAPAGPITAVIVRDRKDRLASVAISGAVTLGADVLRDMQDRISELTITKNGRQQRAIVKRDSKKRIESITLHPASDHNKATP